jgi:pseudaminic acid biosynthesis-associated methylase
LTFSRESGTQIVTKQYSTEQEAFWAGQFGDEYIKRNAGDPLIGSNAALFSKLIANCAGVESLIEFGANVGLNLRAIRLLCPKWILDAIEINAEAARQLREWGDVNKIHQGSILEFQSDQQWDVVLIKGVLIHINPDHLPRVYEALYNASKRYIFLIEYYNPTPVEVIYRGHSGRLFKRDFAGELLDKYSKLHVVDYGFVWHRDPAFPQDDATWFVLEKTR